MDINPGLFPNMVAYAQAYLQAMLPQDAFEAMCYEMIAYSKWQIDHLSKLYIKHRNDPLATPKFLKWILTSLKEENSLLIDLERDLKSHQRKLKQRRKQEVKAFNAQFEVKESALPAKYQQQGLNRVYFNEPRQH